MPHLIPGSGVDPSLFSQPPPLKCSSLFLNIQIPGPFLLKLTRWSTVSQASSEPSCGRLPLPLRRVMAPSHLWLWCVIVLWFLFVCFSGWENLWVTYSCKVTAIKRLLGSLQGTLGTRGLVNGPLHHIVQTQDGMVIITPMVNTASLNQNRLADKLLGMLVRDSRSSQPWAWLCGAV